MSERPLSTTMRVVKGFVVLAILLLIPSMAYFQKQRFESSLQPRLREAAMEILKEEKVEGAAVRMEYLDAVISGRVGSEERREAVAARVDSLPGLRVPPGGNQLRSYGWIRIVRSEGVLRGEGVMPRDFSISLPESLEVAPGWDEKMERRTSVEAPEGVGAWGEFLSYFFDEPGNRGVELRWRGLRMWGDATVGLRSDWLSKASEVVEKDEVGDEFTLHPSVYHFPGFHPKSVDDPAKVEDLRRRLGEVVIAFGSGNSVELTDGERRKVGAAAQVIRDAEEEARYVVGGHPAFGGNVTANGELARKRAQFVMRLLVEHGVPEEQMEVEVFGVTADGTRGDRVEIVLK